MWEQLVLPYLPGPQGLLWNPCNFAPVFSRRQIVTIHDIAPIDHPEWFRPAYRWWFEVSARLFVRRALAVTAVSTFTKRRLEDVFGVEPSRITVIPNGNSLTSRAAGPETIAHGEHPYVLAIGANDPRKNIAAIQAAAALLRDAGHRIGVRVVGTSRPGVFQHHPPGLNPCTEWLGPVSDVELRRLYEGALCLVYPSYYEGFGLPPLEAMAVGTRVVTSNLEPLVELCGDAAVYVDPSDPTTIAAGIETVINESHVVREASLERGRARARLFSWQMSAKMMDQLIERVWIERPGPSDRIEHHDVA
jgi:glycosyltransferase involved in cell wall biosynthesis